MTLLVSSYRFPSVFDRTVVDSQPEPPPTGPHASSYVLPDTAQQEALEVERMFHDLCRWTGWSDRALADVIDTSHPTVGRLKAGEYGFLAGNEVSRRRVEAAHGVVSRAYILAGRDRGRTRTILEQTAFGGMSARQHLCDGRPNEAYLAVIEVLRPPRRSGLMRGSNPIDPRKATTAPADED